MGLIDRIAGAFRRTPRVRAAYEGGSGKGRGAHWLAPTIGPNAALLANLANLRARSRELYRNNGLAFGGVERIVSETVGTGIKPLSQCPDRQFAAALNELWEDWVGESDASGRADFYTQQAQVMRGLVTGGETFARLRMREPGEKLTVPLEVQLISAEFCPYDKHERGEVGLVRAGIEFDPVRKDRPIAFHLYRRHPYDGFGLLDSTALETVRVRAENVLHVFLQLDETQIRGEPWLARALWKLRDLDQYDDAEMQRKKNAAYLGGAIVRKPNGSDPGADVLGAEDADGDGVGDVTLGPGLWAVLEPGEEIQVTSPADLGQSYEPFMRQQHRAIAAALGVLVEQLTGEWGDNDRVTRLALLDFRRRVEQWQHGMLVFQFCDPVWRRFVDLALLSGKLRPPAGLSDADLYRVKWVAHKWSYLHPVQDVQATVNAIRAGLISRDEALAQAGIDAATLDAEIAAANARADGLGLVLDSDPRKTDGSGGLQAAPAATPADAPTA